MTICAQHARPSTRQLLEMVKTDGSDFEWYPTTDRMLAVIKADINDHYDGYGGGPSVLDCGAGDGRALQYLTAGPRYAIEKSRPLIQAMDRSVFIVGTEFTEQTLIDKKTCVVFSNPPYSQYAQWCTKLILEANCQYLYLIIPTRWTESLAIEQAIDRRSASACVLDSFDFTDGDRAARAKVDIVRVDLGYQERYRDNATTKVDPFDVWFDDEFEIHVNNDSVSKYQWDTKAKADQKDALQAALVQGRDIIGVLQELYLHELNSLMNNYKAIETLDPSVLQELDVNIKGLKAALRMKVEGLKDRYWKELFDNMGKITSRLTTAARDRMLDKLMKHTHVDFTVSNAHALMIWVIKSANTYYDSQLVTLVESITENTSIVLYKSNDRVFTREDWRYRTTPESLSRYQLDYRIVLSRVGGLHRSAWEYERKEYNGLSQSAFVCISDIITVANNLGFDTTESVTPRSVEWQSNKAVEFTYSDPKTGRDVVLMSVRAFLNGNMHIKFNQRFIQRLNVEFGRLKGWLKTPDEASVELDIDAAIAADSFGTNLQIADTSSSRLLLSTITL